MSEDLPTGWTAARLKDIVTKQKGKKPAVLRGNAAAGFVPYLDIHAIEKGVIREFAEAKSSKLACADDIFVVWDGARSGWVGGKITGAIGSTIMALTPRQVSSDYLRYYLAGQFQNLNTNTRGTGIPHVDPEVFWNLEVPLAPIDEQRRIVAKLEEVLGKVERSQQRLAKVPVLLKRFRHSVLAAACSGRLTSDWREKNPSTAPASDTIDHLRGSALSVGVRRGVPERVPVSDIVAEWDLPSTWGCYSAAELLRAGVFVDLKDGNHGANHPKVSDFTPTGLPFITAAQVSNYRVDYDGAYKISGEPLGRLRVGFAKPGDVIYTHKGSVGRVAIADRECVLTPQTTYYRVLPEVFASGYLMFYLSSQPFSEQVDVIKEQTTRDFVPISEQYLLFHRIPPLAEQREIVRRVEQLFALADRIEARFQQAKAQVDQLTPALLAKAFRGQFVPQDPADEPASVLLERIRTARDQPVDRRPVGTVRPPLEPQRYFIQLIPALLRAVSRPLALDQLNAAVALLFLPDQLLPLVAATSGRAARNHFESFPQANPPGAFLTAIQFLARVGTLKPVETDTGIMLRLNPAKAPPIAPPVETDARHLAAIIDLIPAAAVKSKLKELQPRQVREALLVM